MRMAILLGLNSGIAQSELLSLRKSDVDVAAQSINIPIKGGVRRVVIPQSIIKKLNDYMKEHEGISLFDFPNGSITHLIAEVGDFFLVFQASFLCF